MAGYFLFSADVFTQEIEVSDELPEIPETLDDSTKEELLSRAKEIAKEKAREDLAKVLAKIDSHTFEDAFFECDMNDPFRLPRNYYCDEEE